MYWRSTSCLVHAAGSSAGRLSSAIAGSAASMARLRNAARSAIRQAPFRFRRSDSGAACPVPSGDYNYMISAMSDTMNVMRFEAHGRRLRVDFSKPASIAIPLDFAGPQPSCFGAPRAAGPPARAGDFVGDTRAGGSCNCEILTLAPHCNGTHTECVGHVTLDRVAVSERLAGRRRTRAPRHDRARGRGRCGRGQRSCAGARRSPGDCRGTARSHSMNTRGRRPPLSSCEPRAARARTGRTAARRPRPTSRARRRPCWSNAGSRRSCSTCPRRIAPTTAGS